MEGQYEAQVAQRGTNLSGGQKQRLSIARAVCRKPEIYIFDDSFSALDYQTDRQLRTMLKKETAGVTSMIVAQRIGTILDADRIVVSGRRLRGWYRDAQGTVEDLRGLSRNRHVAAERGGTGTMSQEKENNRQGHRMRPSGRALARAAWAAGLSKNPRALKRQWVKLIRYCKSYLPVMI